MLAWRGMSHSKSTNGTAVGTSYFKRRLLTCVRTWRRGVRCTSRGDAPRVPRERLGRPLIRCNLYYTIVKQALLIHQAVLYLYSPFLTSVWSGTHQKGRSTESRFVDCTQGCTRGG